MRREGEGGEGYSTMILVGRFPVFCHDSSGVYLLLKAFGVDDCTQIVVTKIVKKIYYCLTGNRFSIIYNESKNDKMKNLYKRRIYK